MKKSSSKSAPIKTQSSTQQKSQPTKTDKLVHMNSSSSMPTCTSSSCAQPLPVHPNRLLKPGQKPTPIFIYKNPNQISGQNPSIKK